MYPQSPLRLCVLITLAASLWLPSIRDASAQSAPPPALAQDGQGLFGQPPEVEASFRAVWGDAAPTEWIRQHDAELSGGAPPSGPRIGFLYLGTASQNATFTEGLANGLRAVGYHPGRDISIIWRFANGQNDRLPSLAAELVGLAPDLIVTPSVESAAVKQLTSSIPIVTLTVSDPVGAGLVASLEHPGGNITGVIQQPVDFNTERLMFLKEAVPNSTRIGLLVPSPVNPAAITALRDTGARLGVEVETLEIRTADELPTAFTTASEHSVDAIMVFATTLFTADRPGLVRLAEQQHIPALYPSHLFLDAGGLMDYAFVEATRGRDAADYIAQIVHGANPADLPMRPPTEAEVVLNLSAAERIGHTFPASVLEKATEIIH
jgi:putative ABC transport system substrate-binding protein